MLVKIINDFEEIVGENSYSTSNDHAKILNNTILDTMTPGNGKERTNINKRILWNSSRTFQYKLLEKSENVTSGKN